MTRFSMLLWILVVLGGLYLAAQAWYFRHPTFADVQSGAIPLHPDEAQAIQALLSDARIDPSRVRVIKLSSNEPHWSWSYWNGADRLLKVYRRFGSSTSYFNGIGVSSDHVISVSLLEGWLTDTTPLAQLPELRHVRLSGHQIHTIKALPKPCRWVDLDLSDNALDDLSFVAECTDLRTLRLAENRLQRLPDLSPLRFLETLNLRANHLETASGLADLPALHSLDLSHNRLTSLIGLNDVPTLRSLHASKNQLSQIEVDVLAACASLRHVGLENNLIEALPFAYQYAGRGMDPIRAEPKDPALPDVSLSGNPVAESLKRHALATHDGTEIVNVKALPRGRGRWHSVKTTSSTSFGLSSHVDLQGTADWLNGALSQGNLHVGEALMVTVTASVADGRLRVYLKDPTDGYRYAETIPGTPLQISGRLITGTDGYTLFFESVQGRATGISWQIKS